MKKILIPLIMIILITGCNFNNKEIDKKVLEDSNPLSKIEDIKNNGRYTKGDEKIDKYDNYTITYTKYIDMEKSMGFATIIVSDQDDIWGYITESTYAAQNDTDEYIIAAQSKLYIQNNFSLYIFDIKTGKLESKIDNFGYGEKYVYSDDNYIMFSTNTHTHLTDGATDIMVIDKNNYKLYKTISAKDDVEIFVREDKTILFAYKMNDDNGESEKEYEVRAQELLDNKYTNELVTIKTANNN